MLNLFKKRKKVQVALFYKLSHPQWYHQFYLQKFTELTYAKLQEIQYAINCFLNKNNISNIDVTVFRYNGNLVIIGNTLIDEIVWEHIQA